MIKTYSNKEKLTKLIGNMPDEDRIILSLYFVEGLSLDEIAFVLGKDSHFINKKISKLIKKIKKHTGWNQ